MKHNLLGAVSTIALGAAFGIGAPGAANAFPLAGTGLICTGTVNAGTCTETESATPVTGRDFSGEAITLDKWYAPAVGDVLTSVTYSPGGNTHVQGTLTNSGSGPSTGSFVVTRDQFTFSGGAGAPSNFLSPSFIQFPGLTGGFTSGQVSLAQGVKSPFSKSNPFVAGPFAGSPVLGYKSVGPSTFTALVTSSTAGGATSNPAAFTANGTVNETAFITITYAYTTPPPPPPPPSPTPEPASLALLGAGLAGLGAIRRRRKA